MTPDDAPSTRDARARALQAEDQPPRVVVDPATGRPWSVRLAQWDGSPAGPHSECLIYDRGDLMRRVWPVPDDWRRMPDDALLALMDRPPGERPRTERTPDPR